MLVEGLDLEPGSGCGVGERTGRADERGRLAQSSRHVEQDAFGAPEQR